MYNRVKLFTNYFSKGILFLASYTTWSLFSLSNENKNGIRCSQIYYEFAFILYTLSPKCYRYIRNIIPFSCKASLLNQFREHLTQGIEWLQSIDDSISILKYMKIVQMILFHVVYLLMRQQFIMISYTKDPEL